MRVVTSGGPRRRAVTLVESAFVLSITLMVLFGIFEYSRFFFLLQVMNHAAREGARYAVAHTGDGTTTAQVTTYITTQLAGRQNELTGMTIALENVNPNTGVASANPWNSAPFADGIRVRISGTYKPILPTFLGLAPNFTVTATSMMSSEAN